MPKERGQPHQSPAHSSPPPLANARVNDSSNSKEKPLQRPQKKFSLASAFPLSSPNRGHHYRQQPTSASEKPRGAALVSADCQTGLVGQDESDDQAAESSPKQVPKSRLRDDRLQTRKLSAPVDYRDSGVYLGEIERDPVAEMWNTIRDRDESGSEPRTVEGSESPIFASSAPVSFRAQMTRRFRRNILKSTPPPFTSAESSKSLPAIDAILLSSDQDDQMHRSTTCSQNGNRNKPLLSDSKSVDDEDRVANWGFAHRLLDSKKPNARRVAKIKPQRNAQSFSSENLIATELAEVAAGDILKTNPDSPSASPKLSSASRIRSEDGHVGQVNFKLDDSDDHPGAANRLVQKRSSLYRRSRSLAEDETARRALQDQVDDDDDQGDDSQKCDDRSDIDRQTGIGETSDRPRGRIIQIRKTSQAAMVQVHSETDSSVCERKAMAAKKKRSLADPIAKKLTLTFLRRRPTGSSLTPPVATSVGGNTMNTQAYSNSATSSPSASHHSPPKPPSREEVRKWAASFEHLLSHKYGVMLFRLFLQREFSEENIDFWTACEEYKKLRDSKLALQARQIYNDFVAVQAPKEVNLDSVTRSSTMAALNNPNKRTFEQAQHRIQSLMEKDSYPRFLRSDLYLDLVRKC